MYQNPQIGNDLRDVLETLEELKRAVEQQARAYLQLEAERAALARQLSNALAAERRQRCRATSSRVFAKRAHAATQPVISTHKELVTLKRQLVTHKKNFQAEKKLDSIQVSSSTISTTTPHSPAVVPPTSWSIPPPPRPNLRPSPQPTNDNSLWTRSGQLVWNSYPVSLTSMTIDRRQTPSKPSRPRPLVPPPVRSQYKPVAGFRTASQLMASQREENENEVSNSQVSQPDCTDKTDKDKNTGEFGDDEITRKQKRLQEEAAVADGSALERMETEVAEQAETATLAGTSGATARSEVTGGRADRTVWVSRDNTDSTDCEKRLKKPRKKRRMYVTPSHDDFDG